MTHKCDNGHELLVHNNVQILYNKQDCYDHNIYNLNVNISYSVFAYKFCIDLAIS